MVVVGVPLLSVGLFLAAAPLLGEPGLSEGLPPALLITVPFGLIFAAMGLLLIFGKWGMEVDLDRGTVARWWGLLRPLRRTERRLAEFDRVVLAEQITEVGGHENQTYAVRLEGAGEPMDLQRTLTPGPARLEAEAVARFTGLPLHDETAEEPLVVRQPHELDESVRERATRQGQGAVPAPPLEDSPVECRVETDALVLHMPRRSLGLAGWWAVVVFFGAWVIPASLVLMAQAGRIGGSGPGLVVLGVLALVFLLVPVLCLFAGLVRHLATRESLRLTPHTLELQRRGLFGTREVRIPAARLEEIRCTPQCLQFISDERTIDTGYGLEPEDLRWIESLAHAILGSPRP
jgi:hypothetical protein